MRDRSIRICLGMIVVLLALIACRQGPTIAHGAAPREYKMVYLYADRAGSEDAAVGQLQAMLNQQAKDGWELVTAPTSGPGGYFTFKK